MTAGSARPNWPRPGRGPDLGAASTCRASASAPTPMLYFAVYHLDADGGIMVTGSHNPPDYNGFKMMLGKKPFFGADIQTLGAMAAQGRSGESGPGHGREDGHPGRLCRAAAAGREAGQATAEGGLGHRQRSPAASSIRASSTSCRASTSCSTRRSTAPFPRTIPTRRCRRTSSSCIAEVREARLRPRHRLRRRRRPHRRGRRQGPHPVGRPAPGAAGARRAEGPSRRHHHRRRQGEPGAVRRDRQGRRQAADVEDRPFADQDARWPRSARRWPAR